MDDKQLKNLALGAGIAVTGPVGGHILAFVKVYDNAFKRFDVMDKLLRPGIRHYDMISDKYPRVQIPFKSKYETLMGYYYKSKEEKGLVVVCHGLHAGADDYIPEIMYFIDNGYNVFSFDYTGTYLSTGDGTVGMCQSVVDLDNALEFLSNDDRFKNQPMFLYGHSWGGYAVCSILNKRTNINAVASINGFNNAFRMLPDKAAQVAGKMGRSCTPFTFTYQKFLFREYTTYLAVDGINNTDIPVFIAQGTYDKVVSYYDLSIAYYHDEIKNPNVKYYIDKSFWGTHEGIRHSLDSALYLSEIESDMIALKRKLNRKLTNDDIKEYNKTIDNVRYSDINKKMYDQIIAMFDNTLKER